MRVSAYMFAAAVFFAAAGYIFSVFVFGDVPHRPPSGRVDAIVVLTGGRGRIDEGLSLLRKDAASVLILSGVNEDSDVDSIFLKRLTNGERQRIILEKRSKSTYENAVEVKRIMSEKGFGSMVLITSRYHMKRAYYIFDKVMPPGISISLYTFSAKDYLQTRAGGKDPVQSAGLLVYAGEFFKYCWFVTLFTMGLA